MKSFAFEIQLAYANPDEEGYYGVDRVWVVSVGGLQVWTGKPFWYSGAYDENEGIAEFATALSRALGSGDK